MDDAHIKAVVCIDLETIQQGGRHADQQSCAANADHFDPWYDDRFPEVRTGLL